MTYSRALICPRQRPNKRSRKAKSINLEIRKILQIASNTFTARACCDESVRTKSSPRPTKMGKAKKTRKFAQTKRLLNTTKDTRIQSVKAKATQTQEKKESNGELVREMYLPRDILTDTVDRKSPHLSSSSITRLWGHRTGFLLTPTSSTFPFRTRLSPFAE